jgi:hypothetical protein
VIDYNCRKKTQTVLQTLFMLTIGGSSVKWRFEGKKIFYDLSIC